MKRYCVIAAFLTAALLPRTAFADITAFLGVNPTPTNRTVKGFAAGAGLLIVGFEFEYADTGEDRSDGAPGLRTFMGNGLVQTPVAIAGMQFYATAGGGIYRERFNDDRDTHVGVNVGGGIKMSLLGPLRLRVDYRMFTLQGSPRYSRPQRVYAGLNLKF